MRKYAIFGNWKMYKPPGEARALAQSLKNALAGNEKTELAVFPSSVALRDVVEELEGSSIGVGSQNIFYKPSGAYTGEISAEMTLACGARYVLVGHSERRHVFGETDEWVNLKLKAALEAGLRPVVCVGETLEQREDGSTRDVVSRQVLAAFEQIDENRANDIIVAYEPVWAIGTGKTATSEQAQEVHSYIRELLAERFGSEASASMIIQYGGSVKPGNAADLLSQNDVDGLLVGGASLDAESFSAIVAAAR